MRIEITTDSDYHTMRLLDDQGDETYMFKLKSTHMPVQEIRNMIPAETEEGFHAAKEAIYTWLAKQHGMEHMKPIHNGKPIEVWTQWPDGRKKIVETEHLPPETMERFSRMITQACENVGSCVSYETHAEDGMTVVYWCRADLPPEPILTISPQDAYHDVFLKIVFKDRPSVSLHGFLSRMLPTKTITPPPGTKHQPRCPT